MIAPMMKLLLLKIYLVTMSISDPNPIPIGMLPPDFDYPTVHGNSPLKTNIFITSHGGTYVILLDHKGNILWYKKGVFHNAKMLRISTGELRYTYSELIKEYENLTEQHELVVLDEQFKELKRIRGMEYGNLYAFHPFTHDYLYYNDNHYVLLFNFPLYERREFAVQEVKNDEVIFHWESNSQPILWDRSAKSFDYAHVNSVNLDHDGNFILSCVWMGFFKLDKQTRQVKWFIGNKWNDFGLMNYHVAKTQHDVHREIDGSITLYDDEGYVHNHSRVVKYWLDEESLELVKFKEYIYHQHKVKAMGGVQIIDSEKDILGITYGATGEQNIMYEEYDFKNNVSLFSISLKYRHGIFKVTRLLE